MTNAPSAPEGLHPTSDLSAGVAKIKVDDQTNTDVYASIPPPGSRTYTPPAVATQLVHHDVRTNYAYQEEPHYLDYQHAIPMHGPSFSPTLTEWNGQLNGAYRTYVHPPVPGMPLGPMSPPSHHTTIPLQHSPHQSSHPQDSNGFQTLSEPFVQLTPISDLQHRSQGNGGEDGRGRARVYRPPHVVQMQQEQSSRAGPLKNIYPHTPQSQRQHSMGFRTGRRDQKNGSGDWPRGDRNGQNGNGHRNGFDSGGGHRRPYSSVHVDNTDVPYTPQPHHPAINRIFIPQHGSPASSAPSPQSPLQSYGLSGSAVSGRQLGARLGQYSGGPMGQFGAAMGPSGQHLPYTPPTMRDQEFGQTQRHMPRYPGQRSSLLEDFRINRTDRHWEAQDLTGYIVEFAGDQHGSRFIQSKIAECSARDRKKVFDEIMPEILTLMQDVFGNYVVQKMFEVGDIEQTAAIAKQMEGRVLSLSMHMYGCRAVQKAVTHLPPEQKTKLIAELEPHFLECVRSNNANHVVQCLIGCEPPRSISTALAGHFQELAMNPFGCRVIQKMFEQLEEEWKREMLEEMHPIALTLMENQYGNYVIQTVLRVGPEEDRQKLIGMLKGKMLAFSRHKFASNVCEKALEHATPEDRRGLIEELIAERPDGSTAVPMLLGDAFGNFPLQFALTCADDDQRAKILDLIVAVLPSIANTPVGRRLSTQLTQWEAEELIASAKEPGANFRAWEASHVEENISATDNGAPPESAKTETSSRSSTVSETECDSSDDDGPASSRSQEQDAIRSSASTPLRRVTEKMVDRGRSLSRTDSSTIVPPARSASTSKTSSRPSTSVNGDNGISNETEAKHDDCSPRPLPN